MSKQTSKVWLVTGCSTGFGRYIVEHLLASGDNVVVTARNISKIADLKHKGEPLSFPSTLRIVRSASTLLQPRRRISGGSMFSSTMPASASSALWRRPTRPTHGACSR